MTKKATQQRYSDPSPKSLFTNRLLQKNKQQVSLSKLMNNQKQQMDMQSKLTNLKKKSNDHYHKIQKKIDKMIEILQQGEKKMDIQENQEVAIQKCLNFIHNSFIYEKPLKSIKDDFVHFYKRLSSFSKDIAPADETAFQNNQFSLLIKTREDLNHFQKCLQNHYFRIGQFQSGMCFNQNSKTSQNQRKFKQCYKISIQIKKSVYQSAIYWIEELQTKKKYIQAFQLQYDLKKAQIINRLEKKHYKSAFTFIKNQMKKFVPQHQAQLNMLLCLILTKCEWNSNLLMTQQSQQNQQEQKKYIDNYKQQHCQNQNGYRRNYQNKSCKQQEQIQCQIQKLNETENQKNEKIILECFLNFKKRYNFLIKENIQESNSELAERFACLYFQVNNMSKFDTLAICYEVASKYKDQYLQLLKKLSKNQFNKIKKGQQKILPFSINVQKQYHYHSLFLCPVTKQVLTSKQGVFLLECGHLISETATKSISEVRNRHSNKNKCPICQKQRKQQPKRVYF